MEPFQSSSQIAQKTWELENNIIPVTGPSSDEIFYYDKAAQDKLQQEKPWSNDPRYFKRVKISALALLKMVEHARSGGATEVIGIIQGKPDGDAIIVMDALPIAVDSAETGVNDQGDTYVVDCHTQSSKQVGRLEKTVGWYHSHPGYGCWLSGDDLSTQRLNQEYTEPFLAVVVDPTRTVSAGKVEIGAFRAYPEGYEPPPDDPPSEYQTIPLNLVSDYGAHCKQYYSLDISYFKSSLDCHLLDLLWNKYWVNTLASSPFFGKEDYVAGQICDLAEKLHIEERQLTYKSIGASEVFERTKEEEVKIGVDSAKIAVEQIHGLMSQVIKNILFNSVHRHSGSSRD